MAPSVFEIPEFRVYDCYVFIGAFDVLGIFPL